MSRIFFIVGLLLFLMSCGLILCRNCSEHGQLTADERDRLVERGAACTDVTHRGVLVPDRHAAEEDEPVRG